MKKTASAHWQGDLKQGKGTVSTQSGALKQNPYGFNTRFEDTPGTNPEELIGAAHASCFSMAFSMLLGEENFTPDSIDTQATVTLFGPPVTRSSPLMTFIALGFICPIFGLIIAGAVSLRPDHDLLLEKHAQQQMKAVGL